MSASENLRRVAVLASIVAGLSACSSASPSEPAPPRRAAAPARPAPPQQNDPVPVKLDTLAAMRHSPADSTRNPFRFQARVAPAPPAARVAPAPPPETRPVPFTVAGPPPPPPIPLKFIGVVVRANGVKWAVLSDGKLTVYGRETDIIDGQYRIVSIGSDSIELAYADGRGRQIVKFTGQ